MNIKDQIRDYDVAFKRAKAAYGTGAYDDATLEFLFPQLKESEDERIRTRLSEYFRGFLEGYEHCYKDGGYVKWEGLDVKSILAWLEKQKEQKPWKVGENAYFTPEQKPAEWDTHDKAIVNCIVCCLDGQFVPEAARKQCLEWFNKHRRDFLNQTEQEWSEEDIKKIRSEEYTKGFNDAAFGSKLKEWSEDDEVMRWNIISIVGQSKSVQAEKMMDWLKSLRPQPQGVYKQVVHSIFTMLKGKDFYGVPLSNCISLLNDIRVKCKDADECAVILDEPSWKPSEEQMEALDRCVDYLEESDNEDAEIIESLQEQLKAL